LALERTRGIVFFEHMSNVVLVVISVMGLFMIYLGIAATLCVVRDRSLARSSAVSRILV
jgi:hypothetical protein